MVECLLPKEKVRGSNPLHRSMNKQNNKLWFKAKSYGWGWTPVTWQGWVVTVVFSALIYLNYVRLESVAGTEQELMMFYIPETIILALILILICYKKGERPEWRWGGKKSPNTRPKSENR